MRTLISFLLILTVSTSFGQTIKQSPNWFEIIEGAYKLRSLSNDFITPNEIEPQLQLKAISKNTAYLVTPGTGLTLFKSNNPTSKTDVAGQLRSNSLIELLEIDYRKTFQDPDTTWKVTHEVWYKFKINGRVLYTDFKIHNLTIKKRLTKLNQVIAIASQDTGYDNYYDVGYPEYFHFLAFNNTNVGLTLEFDSKELDLECNCEFWEPESETYYWKELENGSLFIKLTGIEDTYEATWNGKKLVEK
ncbi:MAG: hypothetical protein ABJG41_14740 [Cyclobacteriaceae bacterium]